jgi:2,3-bisphosphoglycerate-independent phosphoglycerate mutase
LNGNVKYVVLIVDGASGWPVAALDGRTSLEAAHTPNMDRLAREGTAGLAYNVPSGMEASSAVACMSVMGFDPTAFYAGRGPIEAMAMGVELEPGQVAMRCNLVTVTDGIMTSYSAGNISSEEAAELVAALREGLGDILDGGTGRGARPRVEFYSGVSFRNIVTVRQGAELLETRFTAPHDLADKPVAGSEPAGPGAGLALELMERSKDILAAHPVNRARRARGQLAATQIWLFWPGMRPGAMPTFSEQYGGRRAALTTGVDLLRGLAIQTGMDVLRIPGVTDLGDNDFAGQMAGALAALDDHDVVFVHVEAPDEAAHGGDLEGKLHAIEKVDELMVPQVLDWNDAVWPGEEPRSRGDKEPVCLLVTPDHPTPVELKTHVAEPVPFVMWGPGVAANGARAFTEAEARGTDFVVAPGHLLMSIFLEGGGAPGAGERCA